MINIKQRLTQVADLEAILGEVVLLKGLKPSIRKVTLWVQVCADFSHIKVLKSQFINGFNTKLRVREMHIMKK